MGIHHDGLCIRVADDTDAKVPLEFFQVLAEFGAEVGVLYVVDGTMEEILVKGHHTGAFRAEVGVVVYTVEKVRIAGSVRDNTKKTAHNFLSIKRLITLSLYSGTVARITIFFTKTVAAGTSAIIIIPATSFATAANGISFSCT